MSSRFDEIVFRASYLIRAVLARLTIFKGLLVLRWVMRIKQLKLKSGTSAICLARRAR